MDGLLKPVVVPNTLVLCATKLKEGVAEVAALGNNVGLSVENELDAALKELLNDGVVEVVAAKTEVVIAGAEFTLNVEVVTGG